MSDGEGGDDQWFELKNNPCPLCKSITYRKGSEGYHYCSEGHRNDDFLEQDAEEGEHMRDGKGVRKNRIGRPKGSSSNTRVQRKYTHISGRGDHDLKTRYGISPEEWNEFQSQERSRFSRKSKDLRDFSLLEAGMQLLLLQLKALKNDPTIAWQAGQFEACERLARRLFCCWANVRNLRYEHRDSQHPEFAMEISLEHRKADEEDEEEADEKEPVEQQEKQEKLRGKSVHGYKTALDSELKCDEIDNEAAESLLDLERGFQAMMNQTFENSSFASKSGDFKYLYRVKPFGSFVSLQNMTLITYFALQFSNVPILLDDLSARMEAQTMPGYRPDFSLTKDFIAARFITEASLRFLGAPHLPTAAELYANSEVMIRWLSKRCRIADWSVEGEGVLARILHELCVPPSYSIPFRRLISQKCPRMSYRVFDGVFVSPCALMAAGVAFCLKLVYGLVESDNGDDDEVFEEAGLPTQRMLERAWRGRLKYYRGRFNNPDFMDEPITDPEAFDELCQIANSGFFNRMVPDGRLAANGIFGSETVNTVFGLAHPRDPSDFKAEPVKIENANAATLPTINFAKYLKYPQDVNLDSVDEPFRLLLQVLECSVGISGWNLHKIICKIYE